MSLWGTTLSWSESIQRVEKPFLWMTEMIYLSFFFEHTLDRGVPPLGTQSLGNLLGVFWP